MTYYALSQSGGSFLLNSVHDAETTCKTLPDHMKVYLAKNKINFYIINATKIAAELGLGSRTNTIMQAAFFKIANVIPFEKAVEEMKKAILKTYGKKGEDIVKMNYAAVDAGGNAVEKIEVPAEWASIVEKPAGHGVDMSRPEFVRNVVDPINALKGDQLPVSAFNGREGRYVGQRHGCLGEARYRDERSRVADRQLYPVQPVCLRLPPCSDPSVPGNRRRGRGFGYGVEAGSG